MPEDASKTNRRLGWLLWWLIDPTDLHHQVDEYDRLSLFKAIRGQAALCLLLSVAMTTVFILLKLLGPSAYVDVVIMGVLALFIYFGHRWAMIAAMVLWTIEKGVLLTGEFRIAGSSGGATPFVQILWWAIYMHAFYFAFRVEQARRKKAQSENTLPAGPLAHDPNENRGTSVQ
jgi:hypothetical protein